MLRVCPSCSRHARDTTCPFCGADLPQITPVSAPARLSRAGLVGLAATAAVVSACSSTLVAAYGLPPSDAALDSPADGKSDAPITLDAAYGGPPFDASLDATPDAGDGGASDAGDGG
jgi:hypothetical protein